MSMATVETAAKHSMQLVAAAAIGVVVGSIVMSAVEKVAGGRLTEEAQGGRLNLPAAVLASVLHPAQVRRSAWLQGCMSCGLGWSSTLRHSWTCSIQVSVLRGGGGHVIGIPQAQLLLPCIFSPSRRRCCHSTAWPTPSRFGRR